MKKVNVRRNLYITGLLMLLCLISLNYWRAGAQQNNNRQDMVAHIRNGVGAEVKFATPAASPAAVQASVNSVSTFIFNRTGYQLDPAVTALLYKQESDYLAGKTPGIQFSAVAPALSSTLVDRAKSLSEDDILHATTSLSGFNAPDMPVEFGHDNINIRSTLILPNAKLAFIEQMHALQRGQASQTDLFTLNTFVTNQVNDRVSAYKEAMPTFAQQKAGKDILSPLHAFLLIYAMVSDDPLHSTNLMRSGMRDIQAAGIRVAGHYPDPAKYYPFGSNGYIYSSPIDLVLDPNTVTALYNALSGKAGN